MIRHTHNFLKMNGIGNDFAVFDTRGSGARIDADAARRVADRKQGVGCDQVILIEPSDRADVFMRILNADGSEVGACGNATRCVAALISKEMGRPETVIETAAGLLHARTHESGMVTVDMGPARLDWTEVPLARAFADTTTLDLSFDDGKGGVLRDPGAVNVGNPHCVFIVEDTDAYDLAAIGPRIEHDGIFPERANISLAQITGPDMVRLRVWERGAGLTKACGTAACAAAVTAARKGLTGRRVTIGLPGGNLEIEWRESDGQILMTGPWTLDYQDVFDFGETALAS